MSSTSFENYTRLATAVGTDNTEVSGRYGFQASAERRIVPDVAAKLRLVVEDSLLEIGCGPGNLLVPLAQMVANATGIDNEASLARLAVRVGTPSPIEMYSGDFLSMSLPDRRFSKVLVYSVLQYMADAVEAAIFVRRALSLLSPGGMALIGDLPNVDKKRRFLMSPSGERLAREWQSRVSAAGGHPFDELPADNRLVTVDDALVLGLAADGRSAGFECYVLPQPTNLPFGNTREDLLFVSPR